MVSTESELKDDVREMTGYTSTLTLSNDGLDVAYRRAKRHIRIEKALDSNIDWFSSDNEAEEEALFWFTCLFSKVKTGELDSQDLQVGAVDQQTLLAKSDDEVTTWYRNAHRALDSIKPSNIFRTASPVRDGREYTIPTQDTGSGGSSGTTVDETDL